MKNIRSICLIVCLLLAVQMTALPVSADQMQQSDASVINGCNGLDAQNPLCGSDKILKTAQAAMLYEVNTGTMMYSWNPDARMYPASLVKVMTAMLVVENCDMTQTVEVTESAMASISKGAATLKLQPGEILTVDELMYGLMVGSANDAAVVLAELVAGSQSAFVEMMNLRAQELGCTNTVFTNAHGLHDEAQLTTARDMVKILACAMKSEVFMTYFGASDYTIKATNMSKGRYLETTNFLMMPDKEDYYESKVTGGRTGITDQRERALIATAEEDCLSYIVVVMGTVPEYEESGQTIRRFGSYEEAKQLLDIGFDGYTPFQVLSDKEVLGTREVQGGENLVSLVPQNSAMSVLPEDVAPDILTVSYEFPTEGLQAPIQKGDQVATVRIWYGGVCIAQSVVLAGNGVPTVSESPSLLSDRTEDKSGMKTVLIILVVILAVTILAAVALRILKRKGVLKSTFHKKNAVRRKRGS